MRILISAQDKATSVIRGISKGLKKLGVVAKKMGNGLTSAFGKVAKSLLSFKAGLIAVAGIAGMGLMIKSSMQVIDKLGKVSSKLGVTSQELQRFRFAAKLAGVEETALDMGLQRFIRRVGEAAQGTGEAKDALKKMGIQLTDSNGSVKSATDLLGQVANALKDTKDPAERLRLAFKLFDSEGVAMVNMLKGGKAELNATMMEADKLGFVLSDKLVKAVSRANDAWFKMGKALTGVKDKMAGALAPALEKVATKWTEFTVGFTNSIEPLWGYLETQMLRVTDHFGGMGDAGKDFGVVVGWHVAEAAKSIADFFTNLRDGKTDWDRFKETAVETWEAIKTGASGVITAIQAIASAINTVIAAYKTLKSLAVGKELSNKGSDLFDPKYKGKFVGGGIEVLSGSRASGGGVSANQSYLVGERGSETFTPTTSGRISPNAGGSSNVTNIYTNATAHGINNALSSRGDNVSRGARVGMNIARATGMGGYGNLSMARSR